MILRLTACLGLAIQSVLGEQVPLVEQADRRQSASLDLQLSVVYDRGLGSHFRRHKRLDLGQLRAKGLDLDALTQTYSLPFASRQRVTTLREHSHKSLSRYHEARTSPHSALAVNTDHIWLEREIPLPNVTDRDLIFTLAAMTSNAYTAIPHTGEWIDVDDGYNSTGPFGWDDDGLRGHVFASADNSSVVISYKGTSLTGETARKDKKIDNLLFSCCCGRVSYLWRTVCDCFEETYTCNMTCLETELRSPKGYYHAALDIYHNVTSLYPAADIWIVGHSMGGAVGSLVAQTYGIPAVTFQAPGEKLAANRLGLPIVPKTGVLSNNGSHSDTGFAKNIWAFGHTADPIYMGTCGGITSLCWTGGYAMETHCHSGLECIYDVVNDFGWRQGVNTHRIVNVINDVILKYNDTPKGERSDECVDCFNWNS